jgi:hypothetical protein
MSSTIDMTARMVFNAQTAPYGYHSHNPYIWRVSFGWTNIVLFTCAFGVQCGKDTSEPKLLVGLKLLTGE